jgi:hypothetical protein
MESKELVASSQSQSQSQTVQPAVYNLFDDPVLKRAKAELTPEQREAYAKAGEQMYNFDYGSGEQDLNKVLKDACNRVCHMVRQGLHPSLMEKEDLDVINEVIGEEWYKRFGYLKEDLDNIVTVPQELPIPDYSK